MPLLPSARELLEEHQLTPVIVWVDSHCPVVHEHLHNIAYLIQVHSTQYPARILLSVTRKYVLQSIYVGRRILIKQKGIRCSPGPNQSASEQKPTNSDEQSGGISFIDNPAGVKK